MVSLVIIMHKEAELGEIGAWPRLDFRAGLVGDHERYERRHRHTDGWTHRRAGGNKTELDERRGESTVHREARTRKTDKWTRAGYLTGG